MIVKWSAPAGDLFGDIEQGVLLWCDFSPRAAEPADVDLEALELAAVGTPFQRQVWEVLQTIPKGEVWTYKDVAEALGRPSASRAVGQAVGANVFAVRVPCHRVVGTSSLGGYKWGAERKRALLRAEGVKDGRAGCVL